MKNLRNLSNYVADKDGNVYSKETGAVIELTDNADYKLQTDEKVYLETLDKTIKLIRRFTPEQIQTLYRQSNDYTDRELISSNATTCSNNDATTDLPLRNDATTQRNDLQNATISKEKRNDIGENATTLDENATQRNDKTDKRNDQTQRYSINGQVFNSLNDASKELGVHKSTIKRRLDNNTDGYEYI